MTSERPETFDDAATRLDRPSYENLRRAVETGRWPDGRRLDDRQRAICREAVQAWELAHLPPEQRSGYVAPGACATDDAPVPLRIIDGD